MSRSAPQSKVPSPARSPRVSALGERPAHPANKPAGVINMGMTCFLNSTFQSLAATPALISLLRSNPALPLHLAPDSQLPPAVQPADVTPCLRADSLEPPLYPLLPVTRAFTNSLHKAWTMKDNGGGTSGPGEGSSRHSMTVRSLLKELARKYDQYDEFAQQDAHELLRHLLDSMQMEEKDVIKRIDQSQNRTGASAPATPANMPPSSPAPPLSNSMSAAMVDPLEVSPADMLPFVDALFGGLLASVVVCETCKSVSHTYEGFLDISLSMRGDDDFPARQRKRDKFRGIASRLTPRKGAQDPTHATMSEPEGSDSELGRPKHLGIGQGPPPRQPTLSESENGSGGLSRSSSKIGSRVRPSFSFRRKDKERKAAGKSPAVSPQPDSAPAKLEPAPQPPDSGPPTPRSGSPIQSSDLPSSSTQSIPSPSPQNHHHHHHHHAAAPTPAQLAYIQRILYGPPGPPETNDPLAKLRAAHAGTPAAPKDYGLIDALKMFTSVEVLEGDNAFACHKCWKIKMGRYSNQESDAQQSPANGHTPGEVPSIAVENTDADDDEDRTGRTAPRGQGVVRAPSPLRQLIERRRSSDAGRRKSYDGERERRRSREFANLGPFNTSIGQIDAEPFAAPSPPPSPPETWAPSFDSDPITATTSAGALSVDSFASTASATTNATTMTTGSSESASTAFPQAETSESDGLSDSSSEDDDDEPQPDLAQRHHLFRPKLNRAQSRNKHFILRRAFKRYLIAKAPEVLVFHIKRFKQTTNGVYSTFSSLKKLDDFVSFPETLDLAPFMAPNRNDFKVVPTPHGMRAPYQDWPSPEHCPDRTPMPYKLYAVVVHLGTMIGGHYIAYVLVDPERLFTPPGAEAGIAEHMEQMSLDEGEGKREKVKDRRVWCYCSDTEIRLASVDEVMAAKAYLCFYEKC